MARQNALGRVLGILTIVAIVVLAFWLTPIRQMSSAQDRQEASNRPLIARGYTDAATGTVVVAGDPTGGASVIDLRVKEGQKVKRGDVMAVLSNYPAADIAV